MGLNPKQILMGKKNTYAIHELGTWRTSDVSEEKKWQFILCQVGTSRIVSIWT
jgi:hypothetical protein